MTRSKTGETSIFYQYVKPVFLEIFSQFFDEKESEKRAEQAIKTIRKELGGWFFISPERSTKVRDADLYWTNTTKAA